MLSWRGPGLVATYNSDSGAPYWQTGVSWNFYSGDDIALQLLYDMYNGLDCLGSCVVFERFFLFKPSMRPASSKFSDMGIIRFIRCYLSLLAMCRPCWAGVGTHAPLLLALLWTFPWSQGKMCPGKFWRFWESEIFVRHSIFLWSYLVFRGSALQFSNSKNTSG